MIINNDYFIIADICFMSEAFKKIIKNRLLFLLALNNEQ